MSLGWGEVEDKVSITDALLCGGQLAQAHASLLEMKGIIQETYTNVRETIFSLRTAASSRGYAGRDPGAQHV